MRGSVRKDEVDRLADGLDALGLIFRDPDAIAVLELHHQLHEVQRVCLEVLLEAAVLADGGIVDSELIGQVRADPLQHVFARETNVHVCEVTLSAPTDEGSSIFPLLSTPAAASESAVRRTTSCSTPRSLSVIAFAIASGLELPWQT